MQLHAAVAQAAGCAYACDRLQQVQVQQFACLLAHRHRALRSRDFEMQQQASGVAMLW
jgi:hypothetical protein